MKFHFQHLIRAVILLAFSAMIFNLHSTGEIDKFTNPKYSGYSKTVAYLFLFLFVIQLTRIFSLSHKNHHHHSHDCCHHHSHDSSQSNTKNLFPYLVIIAPLITGFLVPPKTLDASIAENKGGAMIISKQAQDKELRRYEKSVTSNTSLDDSLYGNGHVTDPSLMVQNLEIPEKKYNLLKKNLTKNSSLNVTDEYYTVYYDDIMDHPSNYKGKKITLKGFVLKEKDFKQNQLVVSRFLITHCIADASILGLLTEFPEAHTLNEDSWIEVTGTIDLSSYNGDSLPVIKVESWKKINEPKNPYIYPINIVLST